MTLCDNLCTPSINDNNNNCRDGNIGACPTGLIPDNALCTQPGAATGELDLYPALVPAGDTTFS